MRFLRHLRGNIADLIASTLAPDVYIFNKSNPFEVFEDQTKVYGLSLLAAQHLVSCTHRKGWDKAEFELIGHSLDRQITGDWRVTIERIDSSPSANWVKTSDHSANCDAQVLKALTPLSGGDLDSGVGNTGPHREQDEGSDETSAEKEFPRTENG